MAYVTQFDVDQQRLAKRDKAMAGILEGLEGIEENRRRALDEKRKQAEADYQAQQKALPVEERDSYKEKSAIEKLKSEAFADRLIDRDAVLSGRLQKKEKFIEERENRKLQNEMKQRAQNAKIADFDIASPDIVPSPQDAEAVKKYNAANKTFVQMGDRAAELVNKLEPADYTGLTNNYKNVQQLVTEMRLQAKELANLGVLNGPDLTLVDETLGSIKPTDLAIYGKEEVAKRIKSAIDTANLKLQNAAAARGYRPLKQATPAPQLDPEDQAALNWAQSNPNDPRAQAILQSLGAK